MNNLRNGSILFLMNNKTKDIKINICFTVDDILFIYVPSKSKPSYIDKLQEYLNDKDENSYTLSYRNPNHKVPLKLSYLCEMLKGTQYFDIFHLGEPVFNNIINDKYKKFIMNNFDAIQCGYILKKLNVINKNFPYYNLTPSDFLNCDINGFLYGVYGNVKKILNRAFQSMMNINKISFSFPSIEIWLNDNDKENLNEIIETYKNKQQPDKRRESYIESRKD